MAEEIKAQECWRSILADTKRRNVNSMHDKIVVMFSMTVRRCCTDKAGQSTIIAELKCTFGEARTLLFADSTRKFGDVGRDIHYRPVPEAARRGCVRVVYGHNKTLRTFRKSSPGHLR